MEVSVKVAVIRVASFLMSAVIILLLVSRNKAPKDSRAFLRSFDLLNDHANISMSDYPSHFIPFVLSLCHLCAVHDALKNVVAHF